MNYEQRRVWSEQNGTCSCGDSLMPNPDEPVLFWLDDDEGVPFALVCEVCFCEAMLAQPDAVEPAQ